MRRQTVFVALLGTLFGAQGTACIIPLSSVCPPFRGSLTEMCLKHPDEAVMYKQLVCALNVGCCTDEDE